jgi:alpha-L-rhamnosidase
LKDDSLHLDVSIPPNTTATVHIPARDAGALTEGGQTANEAEGVTFLRMESGRAVYEIRSGTYTFVSQAVRT